MTEMPVVTLNDGTTIPQLGFGVWQVPDEGAVAVVSAALRAGYRHIDTAAAYGNERGVGEALRQAGIPRQELYVTTKLWNDAQGYDSALRACEESLKRLGLDHVDLYLIHWPAPHKDAYLDTWRAFVELQKQGRVRSIGVSNFQPAHLERIIGETGVTPVLNQIELHPRLQQRTLRDLHARLKIATEAWSPLGQGRLLSDPVIAGIAEKHGKQPAQIILAWHLALGNIVIPKSVTPARIVENIDVFDVRLDVADLEQIAALDDPAGRIGPNPDTATF